MTGKAQLFGRERFVITRHIRNIFAEDEFGGKSNVQNVHIPNSDKPMTFYSLDVILAVGYRVKSPRGTQFRQWATTLHDAARFPACRIKPGQLN
jgi:hypothetical protein